MSDWRERRNGINEFAAMRRRAQAAEADLRIMKERAEVAEEGWEKAQARAEAAEAELVKLKGKRNEA